MTVESCQNIYSLTICNVYLFYFKLFLTPGWNTIATSWKTSQTSTLFILKFMVCCYRAFFILIYFLHVVRAFVFFLIFRALFCSGTTNHEERARKGKYFCLRKFWSMLENGKMGRDILASLQWRYRLTYDRITLSFVCLVA